MSQQQQASQQRQGAVFPGSESFHYAYAPETGFSLFLERRCKRVYFIRHAEGYHNVAERESTLETPSDVLLERVSGKQFWDARLTSVGEQQCLRLRDEIESMPHQLDIELVVVSPLTRTLQTAELALGPSGSAGAPRFLAFEMCRERIADFMCDGRRSISELSQEFPNVDFSFVKHDDDVLFYSNKEDDEICKQRAVRFLSWLDARPETRIAVVTHSIFLKNLFSQYGFDVAQQDSDELRRFPRNAEMRGLMLCSHRPTQMNPDYYF